MVVTAGNNEGTINLLLKNVICMELPANLVWFTKCEMQLHARTKAIDVFKLRAIIFSRGAVPNLTIA